MMNFDSGFVAGDELMSLTDRSFTGHVYPINLGALAVNQVTVPLTRRQNQPLS